nr:MAG TPA: hypothetical protein [Caudoviricetes sp.]
MPTVLITELVLASHANHSMVNSLYVSISL